MLEILFRVLFCSLASLSITNAEGTLKQGNGFHYITGKGCGISTPIKYLEEIPESIEGMSCTIIRPKKEVTKSQKIEDLHDHWRFKPIEECEFKNMDIQGFGMYAESTEADKFECARKCREHKHCEYFVFLASGYCSLRWLMTSEPQPAHPDAYPDLLASYKSCTFPQNGVEDCQFHDLELGGDGKFVSKTEDEYECARKCRDDEECQGFVFVTKDFYDPVQANNCFFKWNFGSPHTPYFTFEDLKSGYDSCRNDYNPIEECEFRDVDIPKAQSETVLYSIPNEKACARECQKELECDFFVYLTEETDHYKNCVLKFGIEGAEVVEGKGLLSSYRTCKFL